MSQIIIGIDEVGRGALAGPVAVTALALPLKSKIKSQISKISPPLAGSRQNAGQIKNKKFILKDSKKLSAKQREIWFNFIKEQKIPFALASVSPKIIDKINISQAANLAATKALKKLLATSHLGLATRVNIFLDGGLFLNKKILLAIGYTLNSKIIIKGDEKIPAISLASIVAKVKRDKLMKKLHKKYPQYDFINNVGYGVKKHIKAIKKFGRSPIHRKSFILG